MRIAVLADIHGNLRALEAVLADVRAQSPDLVVNLGDHWPAGLGHGARNRLRAPLRSSRGNGGRLPQSTGVKYRKTLESSRI